MSEPRQNATHVMHPTDARAFPVMDLTVPPAHAGFIGPTLRRGSNIARYAVMGLMFFYGLTGVVSVARQTQRLPLLVDGGYGDSYIMFNVMRFQRAGTIYRDLSRPPYLAAQYSPAVYMLYSLPGRIMTAENFFVGPRLLAVVFFVACLVVVGSLTQALVPLRSAALWGVLLTCSIGSVSEWVIQLRGDFPGIFFSLLAVRLLLSTRRWAVPLAGLCAGLALQFKITFVTAGLAGTLWLMSKRQWKDVAQYVTAAAFSSLGLYILYWMREPAMLSQMLALSPGIPDVRGAVKLAYAAASDFVAVLALLGLPLLLPTVGRRWTLLLLFSVISFAIAALTAIQAGANSNYFFEAGFALVPLAVLGATHLFDLVQRTPGSGLFVVALLGIFVVAPRVALLRDEFGGSESVTVANTRFRQLETVLAGRRLFSTVPRIALIDSNPPLVEPYLFTYSSRLGKIDPQPLVDRVRAGEFDVAITRTTVQQWRHVLHIQPLLHQAITGSYEASCALGGWLVHLPHVPHSSTPSLVSQLGRIGCVPYDANRAPLW